MSRGIRFTPSGKGKGFVAVVSTAAARDRRIPTTRKECVMEGGLRFVLHLTEREWHNIKVLSEGAAPEG